MDIYIMSRDTAVGVYRSGNLEILNGDLIPLYLKNTGNVERWLETRAIDSHRANSRLLKKALRLSERDDISTVIAMNAATITDCYWVKPIGSELNYSDIRFDNDLFANLALTGSYDSFNKAASSKHTRTPELTNTGSFEKCWRLADGSWQMYKKAEHNEMFSELFIYRLGHRLGFNMARYERGKGFIKTKDFTNNAAVSFEPAYSFMGDNEDYTDTLDAIRKLCPAAVGDYAKMLFLDTICANPNRHTFNFGILRSNKDGHIIGLAPNFDNNMALISRGYPNNISRTNDFLVKLFNELISYDTSLKQYLPEISENLIRQTIAEIGMRVRVNLITEFVMNGYRQIRELTL